MRARETLITFLLSDAAAQEESLLVARTEGIRSGGDRWLRIARTQALRREHDLLIELGLDEPEYARLAVTAIPAQLLGLAVGLRKRAES